MDKQVFINYLAEVVTDYQQAIVDYNANRRVGMGDAVVVPSIEGFFYWLRNGSL